jgi:hypothetical protein
MIQLPIGIATLLLGINISLQVLDGLMTYYGLQAGFQEGNPLVRAAMEFWGIEWGLLVWKVLACSLLGLLYSLRRSVNVIPGLVVTAGAYIVLSLFPWMGLLLAQPFQRMSHHDSGLLLRCILLKEELRAGGVCG